MSDKKSPEFDFFINDEEDDRYEASRDTDEGIIISTDPDYCYAPNKIVPYTIFAKQSDDANTAATVLMTGKRAHTSASLITTCYGNEAGTGGGVDSGTHNGVCRPKSWSNKVFIEGHNAVRDGDEWFMNNGNTTGILSFKVRPRPKPSASEDGEENASPESSEAIDPITTASTGIAGVAGAVLDGYGNLKGAIEYQKLLQRGNDLLREARNLPLTKIGKVAKFATGVGTFLGTFFAMDPSYRGAFADQWVSHKGLDPSFDEIYYAALSQFDEMKSKGYDVDGRRWLNHWNGILTEYQARAMAGDFGPTTQTISQAAAAGTIPPEMQEWLDRDKVVITGTVAAALATAFKFCQHLACPPKLGPYRGGAHWCTAQPVGDGLDSHHMPAQGYGNKFPPPFGPAIQMTPADHRQTASNPTSWVTLGKDYKKQAALLAMGQNYAAFMLDVEDIEDIEGDIGHPGKYAAAVTQAKAYMNCLKANKLVQ